MAEKKQAPVRYVYRLRHVDEGKPGYNPLYLCWGNKQTGEWGVGTPNSDLIDFSSEEQAGNWMNANVYGPNVPYRGYGPTDFVLEEKGQ